ncbi:MAG: FxsA family protein [Propionibacteriaceae bacterium]
MSRGPGRGRQRTLSWGFVLAVVLLVALPIAEIWLLVQVSHEIGFGWTLLVLIAEVVLGGWLMLREGAKAWATLSKAYGTGRLPSGELANAALVLVGGGLVLLPGFLSDVLGLIVLLPFTRPLARRALGFLIARRVAAMGLDPRNAPSRSQVIEGETVADPSPDPDTISGEIEGDDRR